MLYYWFKSLLVIFAGSKNHTSYFCWLKLKTPLRETLSLMWCHATPLVTLVFGVTMFLFFFFFSKKIFLSLYHNKIHRVTNYVAIKNKINKARQQGTSKRKQNKLEKKTIKKIMSWKYMVPAPSLFILKRVSINHMINRMPFL